jgi:general secretion pathway protein C
MLKCTECAYDEKGSQVNIRKVLFVSKLVLLLVLGCLIVRAVLLLQPRAVVFAPASAVATQNPGAPEAANSMGAGDSDTSVIIRRNIFGDDHSAIGQNSLGPNVGLAAAVPSAEKELGLTLVGVVCGAEVVSRAVIRDEQTSVLDLYRIGQVVAGARVESIQEDAVILLHNGQRKMLSLKTAGRGNESSTRAPSFETLQTAQDSVRRTEPEASAGQADSEAQTGIGRVEAILKQAVIRPHTVNGQVEGLRLSGLENIPAAAALGLRNGDVVRSVNGHTLTSKQRAFQVLMKAKSQPTISLELSRGEKTKKLSFDLR